MKTSINSNISTTQRSYLPANTHKSKNITEAFEAYNTAHELYIQVAEEADIVIADTQLRETRCDLKDMENHVRQYIANADGKMDAVSICSGSRRSSRCGSISSKSGISTASKKILLQLRKKQLEERQKWESERESEKVREKELLRRKEEQIRQQGERMELDDEMQLVELQEKLEERDSLNDFVGMAAVSSPSEAHRTVPASHATSAALLGATTTSVTTSAAPLVPAAAPLVTTAAPLVATTAAPLVITTAAPLITAAAPLVTTTAVPLVVTTAVPLIATTSAPVVATTAPSQPTAALGAPTATLRATAAPLTTTTAVWTAEPLSATSIAGHTRQHHSTLNVAAPSFVQFSAGPYAAPHTWPSQHDQASEQNGGYYPQGSLSHPYLIRSEMENLKQNYQQFASSVNNTLTLPKSDMQPFHGDPTDYFRFISTFDANIASRVYDDHLKLTYLIQYCCGDAKESICDCVILNPQSGYTKARQILLKRFGKPHLVARAYVKQLIEGPAIKPSDHNALTKLSMKMDKCLLTLSEMGFCTDLDNCENLLKIVRRLPMYLRAQWADRADYVLESGREPNFKDLAKFVEDKARSASTIYGQDLAVSDKSLAKPPVTQQTKITTLVTQGESNRSDDFNCAICSENHMPWQCPTLEQADLEERRARMRKRGLCFNCFRTGHMANDCTKQSFCRVKGCTMKHNTLFHPATT